MRAAIVALLIATVPACDSGKTKPEATAKPQRWRLVGTKTPVEVATEAECKELVSLGVAKAKEAEAQTLDARKAEAELAKAKEAQACAEAKILCDISTPAKKQRCDDVRRPLEAKCNEATEARKAAEKELAAPVPAAPTLTCEPAAAKP